MRTVYANVLKIETGRNGDNAGDTQRALVKSIRNWVEEKYLRNGYKVMLPEQVRNMVLPENGGITLLEGSHDEYEYFEMEWLHDGDLKQKWRIVCGSIRRAEEVELSIRMQILTLENMIRPMQYKLGVPRLIRDVVANMQVTCYGDSLYSVVKEVAAANVRNFVLNELTNPIRKVPIILVSPDSWHSDEVVQADVLLQSVIGSANVYKLKDKWAAFKLTETVGGRLSCYDGAVRLYWPGFEIDSSPNMYPLFTRDNIFTKYGGEKQLGAVLLKRLEAVAVFHIHDGELAQRSKERRSKTAIEEGRLLKDSVTKGLVEKDKLESQLLEALEKVDALEQKNIQLRADLQHSHDNIAALVQYQHDEGDVNEHDDGNMELPQKYASVEEAVDAAQRAFGDQLVFLPSVLKSARKSPFKNANRVYELIEATALLSDEWTSNDGRLGRSWEEAYSELGFEYKDKVSQTAIGKYKEDYSFYYKDETVLFCRHVTIGSGDPESCLSMHMYRDDLNKRVVIGHCGRHLRNTKT